MYPMTEGSGGTCLEVPWVIPLVEIIDALSAVLDL